LQGIIQDAHAQGIIFLGAAGNEPVSTPTYPAAYPDVVAVTSLNDMGNVASYANYGDFVDIATLGSVTVNFNGQAYRVTGTSASTALASGLAAGIAEKNKVTVTQAEQALRKGLGLEQQ
jgi:thermitase